MFGFGRVSLSRVAAWVVDTWVWEEMRCDLAYDRDGKMVVDDGCDGWYVIRGAKGSLMTLVRDYW